MSFRGASKVAPGIEPGEMEQRFGADWDIEHLADMTTEPMTAAFLMTRQRAAH
jgi:hypothetical protein